MVQKIHLGFNIGQLELFNVALIFFQSLLLLFTTLKTAAGTVLIYLLQNISD